MTLETETVLDRRRMRRRLSFWRVAAVIAAALAIGALAYSGSETVPFGSSSQVARVAVEGLITEDRDKLKLLKRIAEAKHVKGVIVFVNSPGGTTTGGEALFDALRQLAAKKPVVAQFGTIAASAAYITGLATDHIVARGNTITGSVGVIFQWAEVSQLLDKVGVKMNEVKSGPLKAVPSPFAPLDERGRKITEEMVAESQKWFVSLVSSRRGIDPASVPGLTDGRVYSGREALHLKLVDEIGGEGEALAWLQEKRGVPKSAKIVDWKPKDDFSWTGLAGEALAGMAGAFGLGREEVQGLLRRTGMSRLALDGLQSVWHPREN
jgi:protease-4